MKTPLRTCAGCGAKRPKREMIRVCARAGGEPALSPPGKAPGRGAYLCPDARCLEKAWKTGGLARSLRTRMPERLLGELELAVKQRQKVQIG